MLFVGCFVLYAIAMTIVAVVYTHSGGVDRP